MVEKKKQCAESTKYANIQLTIPKAKIKQRVIECPSKHFEHEECKMMHRFTMFLLKSDRTFSHLPRYTMLKAHSLRY